MKKTILDTNVFIRFLIKDNLSQYEKAKAVFKRIEEEKEKGLVSILVVNEIVWILENYYEIERENFIPPLIKIFLLKNMEMIEMSKKIIIEILKMMKKSQIDFTDYYLFFMKDRGDIFSFDRDFNKIRV